MSSFRNISATYFGFIRIFEQTPLKGFSLKLLILGAYRVLYAACTRCQCGFDSLPGHHVRRAFQPLFNFKSHLRNIIPGYRGCA